MYYIIKNEKETKKENKARITTKWGITKGSTMQIIFG